MPSPPSPSTVRSGATPSTGEHAEALAAAFRRFDADDRLSVAVLTGAGGVFCAGADLKAVAEGRGNRMTPDGDGPMGPTRLG